MQQTCRVCNNFIPVGATTCSYCGTPVNSTPYGRQNFPAPPGTSYGPYTQTSSTSSDPYAAQYSQPALPTPPPAPAFGPSNFATPQQPFMPQKPLPPRKPVGAIIGIILAVVIVLGGLGAGAFFLLRKGGSANTPTSTAAVSPTAIPSLYQSSLTTQTSGWDCGTATCSFNPDGYHISTPDDFVYTSFLTKQQFTDMVIQVNGIISQGDPTNAGLAIAFRTPPSNTQAGYAFLLYGDGTYALVRWDSQGKASDIIQEQTSPNIHQGLQQQNTFKIVIKGSEFTIFANDQKIAQAADSTYAKGYIGLGATGKGTLAIFSDLLVTNPDS
ncbi:MAG TPA: family 16 glycoside hydrolase [Ktedonobacterales bacterium]